MKKQLLFSAIALLVTPLFASAASVSVDAPKNASKGQEVLVTVRIDTGADKINAVSGALAFDPALVDVLDTYEGGSAVTIWIDRPRIGAGLIVFSGITPGGFQGKQTAFSFKATFKKEGQASFSARDLQAYKNNGEGTPVPISFAPQSSIIISGNATGTVALADVAPPEVFAPVISSSPDLFGGVPFVSWSAQDKGTGIDHYEYAYARWGVPAQDSWKPATSPLALDSGSYSKKIFIKAVDKMGKERVVGIAGPNRYRTMAIWGIIVLIALCAFPFLRRRSS